MTCLGTALRLSLAPSFCRCRAAITGAAKGRPVVVIATNDAARGRGLKAGDLVRVAAGALGGGGGGKDDIAQGGGQDASKVGEALAAVEWRVGELAG